MQKGQSVFLASLPSLMTFRTYLNTKIQAVLQSNGQRDKQTNETSAVYSSLVPYYMK